MYLWSLPVYVLILYTFVEHEPHIPENWSWANKELNQTSKKNDTEEFTKHLMELFITEPQLYHCNCY